MGTPATEERDTHWWPAFRTIDGVGIGLFLALAVWVWWASRAQGADGGPLIRLVLVVGLIAVLARWATFFHGTGAPALLAIVLTFVALFGEDYLAEGIGPDMSVEAAGALLAVGTGAAAVVVVRARPLWAKAPFGLLAVLFAYWTIRTGSLAATALALFVLLATLALLALPMRERRWVVIWPGLVAVLILLGTLTYAALPFLPAFGDSDPTRVARWGAGMEAVGEEPLYGVGRGPAGASLGGEDDTGWVHHELLQVTADTGFIGGALLLALLCGALAWVARPGGGPGSVVAAVVLAGSIAHACLEPIWHVPAVPLALAALAGTGSTRGGQAAWRLEALLARITESETVDRDEPQDGASDPARNA